MNSSAQISCLAIECLSGGFLFKYRACLRTQKAVASLRLLSTVLLASGSFAQESSSPAEPQYVNQFFSLDSASALKPLERFIVKSETTRKFRGRGSSLVFVPNEHSSVRFTNPDVPAFIVRFQSRDTDPATAIQFFRFTSKSGRREIDMTKGRIIEIPYTAAKVGVSSFRIIPQQPLPAGEYVLSALTTQEAFCFGVDGSASPASISSQTAKPLTEPEYRNRYYVLTNGTLQPLEHVTLAKTTRYTSHIVSGSQDEVEVAPGSSSSVQVAPDSHFVVRPITSDIDPQTVVHLRPFNVGKGERNIVTISTSLTTFHRGKSTFADDKSIKVSIRKFGADCLEIIPEAPLPPGEYLFAVDLLQADCFSVSAK